MSKVKKKRKWLSIRQKMLTSYMTLVLIILVLGVIGVESIYRVYINGNTIYYSIKGSEPVEIDHSSTSTKATNDDYSCHGILYYGSDKNYYFITKGTAAKTVVEP